MTKRLFGSLFLAGVLAALLFGASALFLSGSTQAQGQSPAISNSIQNGVVAQAAGKSNSPLGVWATIAPFPTVTISPTPGSYPLKLKRANATSYFPNGRLYVLGGRHGVDGEDSSLHSIYEYTPGNPGTWLAKAAQIDPGSQGSIYSSNMAVVTLTDTNGVRIYAIGGSSVNSQPISTTRVYDPLADSITTLTSDPWPAAPVHIPGGWAVVNNKLYIFGGYSSVGTPTVFADTWRFDPMAVAGSRWTQLASANLPQARGFIAGAALNGNIYAIGGDVISGGLSPVATVSRLDPNAGSPVWTNIASLPTARGDMGAWAYDTGQPYEIAGHIAVAGGVYPTPTNVGYLYDPGTDSWGAFPNLVFATRNYGAAQLNGYLYAFGGYDYSGGLPSGANFNQRYDATTPPGTPTSTVTGTPPTATRTNTTAPATSTTTASATVCTTNYTITTGTATIVPGTTSTGNACDDCTSSVTLPFSYSLYNQSFTTAEVGSNGILAFGSADNAFTNTCLPSSSAAYQIFPYWDDQRTDGTGCAGGACGIFTSVSGSAPNRIFNIEWRTTYFNGAGVANYEVRLYEGQNRFDIVYGTVDQGNSPATAGVQKDATNSTQYFCDGAGGTLTPGLLVTYTRSACTTGTPTTATSTPVVPTSTPTSNATATCVPAGGIQDVGIANFAFSPQTLNIPAGTTVRWTNNGGSHSTTSDTALWDSGVLSVGGQFSYTFNTPGTYTYHCLVHPGSMTATINVLPSVPCATATVVLPTSTRTNTTVPASATSTRTNTSAPATSTRTGTSVVPSSTTTISVPTGTIGIPPSSTATSVASETATAQVTSVATATTCTLSFTDVLPDDPFYPFIRCLVCRGIVSGYSDGTFRPSNDITRGQIAKMVSNSAGYEDVIPTGTQTFTDVLADNPFYLWIERVYIHGTITGYPCGGIYICDNQGRPYFRPYDNATRGQLSKIVAIAAGITDPVPAGQQTYADVLPNSTFYVYIEQLTALGVMTGYPCGGVNPQTGQPEPCDAQSRPYFRPNNRVSRGQSAKIVANTFFPNCQTPQR